jgi:hypothetical protein
MRRLRVKAKAVAEFLNERAISPLDDLRKIRGDHPDPGVMKAESEVALTSS